MKSLFVFSGQSRTAVEEEKLGGKHYDSGPINAMILFAFLHRLERSSGQDFFM